MYKEVCTTSLKLNKSVLYKLRGYYIEYIHCKQKMKSSALEIVD